MRQIEGIVAVLVTPRDDDGSVNLDAMQSHVRFLKSKGFSGPKRWLIVTGSIGECAALELRERAAIWKMAVTESKGEVGIIAGINDTHPDRIAEMATEAKSIGVDAVMLMSPYYWRPCEETVRQFFARCLREITTPVLLYNNIPATQIDLSPELMNWIVSEFDQVVAIKECTPNFFKLERTCWLLAGSVNLLNGNGEFWEPYASLMGCKGMTSGIANFAPEITQKLWDAVQKQEYSKAISIKKELEPFFEVYFQLMEKYGMSAEPAVLKAGCEARGYVMGPVKPPACALSRKDRERVMKAVAELNWQTRSG